METTDKKILNLIEILKQLGVIRFDIEFCRAIEIKKQNLIRIKNGDAHFTVGHIHRTIKEYKVNGNWIFDFSDKIFLTHQFDKSLEGVEVL